jgi:hypothetical protein
MDNEVSSLVYDFVDAKRLSGPRLNPTELVERMGVRNARDEPYEYAWLAAGDSVIATLWAEFIRVHPGTGHWYYVESLDTQHRLGGGERDENQKQRATRRLTLLKKCFESKRSFRGVLQINRVPIAELERNRSAKVAVRVKDDTEWFVASWEPAVQRAVLVRGSASWAPSAEDLERLGTPGPGSPRATASAGAADKDHEPLPPATPKEVEQPDGAPRLVFPDQALRDRLEAAAMEHMTREFESQRMTVKDVSDRNLGYDLEVTDEQGACLHKVEVKGTSALTPCFFLTRNERACARRESTWLLAVVIDALVEAKHRVYTPQDMEQSFEFEALVWRCDLPA